MNIIDVIDSLKEGFNTKRIKLGACIRFQVILGSIGAAFAKRTVVIAGLAFISMTFDSNAHTRVRGKPGGLAFQGWRQRVGAMGGGTETRWRCRKMGVITDSWVMAADPE